MSEFVCKKPITLSGHSFSYGEVIPDGYVLPKRALALIRSSYIAEIESGLLMELAEPIQPIQAQIGEFQLTIPIVTEKGNLELTTSSETVVIVFAIMQKTVEEAAKDIAVLEDEDALILLNAIDSRKGIQKAAEERNAKLHGNSGVPEEIEASQKQEDNVDTVTEGESTGDV